MRLSTFALSAATAGSLLLASAVHADNKAIATDEMEAYLEFVDYGGGVIFAVGFFAFTFAKKRTVNFFGGALHLPKSNQIDKPLVIGAVLFGAGWGLAGFCPGPGLVSLASGQVKGVLFVVFMLIGMQLFEMFNRRGSQPK